MAIFVRASRRARAHTRQSPGSYSKLYKASRKLGLPKVRLLESHAYQQFKKAQEFSREGGYGGAHNMNRLSKRHVAIRKLRMKLYPYSR